MNKKFSNALDNAQAYVNSLSNSSFDGDISKEYREENEITDEVDELMHVRYLLTELVESTDLITHMNKEKFIVLCPTTKRFVLGVSEGSGFMCLHKDNTAEDDMAIQAFAAGLGVTIQQPIINIEE